MKNILIISLLLAAIACAAPPKRIAAIVTEYRHNSHADVIVGRLLQTYTLDDKGKQPNLKLVSLYTDQVPKNDTSRKWATKYGVPIYETVEEIVAVSYHTLDAYGFHALEMVQCLAERRAEGETGVKQVRCLSGEAVWHAMENGAFDKNLLQSALGRLKISPISRQPNKPLREMVKKPDLFVIEYRDGLKVSVLTLNGAVSEWAVAWKTTDNTRKSTMFWTQEMRPFMHFTYLVKGTEKMFQTKKPTWPAERTLMTSALLDALLISKSKNGAAVPSDYLDFKYTSKWNWKQPPPPPPGRPWNQQ